MELQEGGAWRPSDDVYQLGQLVAMLLCGHAVHVFRPRDVASLNCSARSKAIIQRAIGERRKRWNSAAEMLRAFEPPRAEDLARGSVDSLSGKTVVFKVEGGPPNSLYRQGWRKDTVKTGDTVSVTGVRAKIPTSTNIGVATITTSDGKRIFGAGGQTGARGGSTQQ